MKGIVVSILILLIATQAFSKWIILLEYQVNKENIALNLCEKRAQSGSTCKGKCQLKKALKQEGENAPEQQQKVKFVEVQLSLPPTELKLPNISTVTTRHFYNPDRPIEDIPSTSIFHPPLV